MTPPTPAAVRQRIMDVCDQSSIVAFVSDGTECKLTDAQLPAVVVSIDGTSGRDYTSSQRRAVTREYRILFLVARPCSDSEADQLAALAAVWAVLDDLPDYFARYADRLELTVAGLPSPLIGVTETGHMRDEGGQFALWGDDVFAATVYRLPVTTSRA